MKSLKSHLIFFFTLICLSSQAMAQMDVIDLHNDGKTVQVQDDHSKRVSDVKIKKGKSVHTAKAYGTMYLSFLASMIATELWYCNKDGLTNVADFEETPTCRDELYQMMADPSMHAGIFAMTYTSLWFTNLADRKRRNILQKMLRSKAEKPIAILQTLWQSIGMGLGISVQTIVNSTYNSPSLPQCMSEFKKSVLKNDSTVEEAMKTDICKEAYQGFVSYENGTMSEITVAMYSLAISTAATMAVMTTVRLVGMVFLGASPQGFLFRGGLFVANGLIEFFDRAMETTVRKYYHIWRSERILEDNVSDLIKSLEKYEKTGSFFGKKIIHRGRVGVKRGPRKTFNILQDLKEYNKNIDYRRRSKLNTFIDSQSRWKQKLSGISEIYTLYKSFLKTVLDIRNERKNKSDLMHGSPYSYNPMRFVGMTTKDLINLNLKDELMTDQSDMFLSSNQIEALKNTIKAVLERHEDKKDLLLKSPSLSLMKRVLKNAEEDDFQQLRVNIWRLKGYMHFNHGPGRALVGRDRQGPLDNLSDILNGVSSFLPATAYGLIQFEKNGMTGSVPSEKPQEVVDKKSKGISRKRGANISTESVDVLSLHPHVSSAIEHSMHKLANLLLHSVCNPNTDIIYDYSDGDVSKVTLPSMLKLPSGEKYDCIHRSNIPSDRASSGATADHYFNPENGKIVRIKTNQALHSIYVKDGHEYIGLIDLLTSPEVEVRWNSVEELSEYWSKEVIPGYLKLLGKGKMNYQEFLLDHYKLFDPDTGFIAYFLESDSAATQPETLDPKSNKSFRERDLEKYYEGMKAGQTFLDQIRTVQHIYKTIGVKNERSKFLETYFKDLTKFLRALDVTAYLDIQTSDEFVLGDLSINPLYTMLGKDKYVELVNLNNKISDDFAKLSEDLKEIPKFEEDKIKDLSEDDARLMIEKEAFEALQKLYTDAIFGELYTDYLTGDGFIYSKELDADLRNGTNIE